MNAAQDGRQILVCDDEPHLREMVAEYLGERGYAVVEAASAAKMKSALETGAPDLIVLDINMPGTDGLTALRELRATSGGRGGRRALWGNSLQT